MCVCDHTHNGTPSLRPSAYKSKVEGVSSRCGIEQIREAKAKEHEPKRTIPANWGLRQGTLPQTLFCLPLRVWSRQNTEKSTLEF